MASEKTLMIENTNEPDPDERTQVLVVGGSLTGLSAAVFLARQGVEVTVVERHAGTLPHPRLRGITPRTVEVYREAGLEPAIRDACFGSGGQAFVPLRADTLAGEYVSVGNGAEAERYLDPKTYSPCDYGMIDQDKLELLLRDRAVDLGAILSFGTELVSFSDDSDSVHAVVRRRSDGAERRIHAGYLIAADGSNSPIRDALEIASDGPGVLFQTITAMVEVDLSDVVGDRTVGVAYLQQPRPFTVMLPHDAELTRWIFSTGFDPERESVADFDADTVATMVRAAAGLDVADRRPIRPIEQIPGTGMAVLAFPIGARVARAYRRGRVFLAGDAARIQPPTGGFGGSTGVQDAHNLAWKLAAVLRDEAGDGLLDSYEAERGPYGRLAMEQAMARFGDRMAGDGDGGLEMLDMPSVIAGFRYRSSAVVGADDADAPMRPVDPAELSAEAGTRAPHRADDGGGGSTLDRYGSGFVLLTAAPERWTGAVDAAVAAFGVPLTYLPIDVEEATSYGLASAGAVLVRPDGFVAWRTAGTDERTDELIEVLGRILDR